MGHRRGQKRDALRIAGLASGDDATVGETGRGYAQDFLPAVEVMFVLGFELLRAGADKQNQKYECKRCRYVFHVYIIAQEKELRHTIVANSGFYAIISA